MPSQPLDGGSLDVGSRDALRLDAPRLAEVAAVAEVLKPPSIPRLHFWALQVDFVKAGKRVGSGHFGLQFHPDYPSNGAVNWGGYAAAGGQLKGSRSALPSTLNNINSRNYLWHANNKYRYRIYPAPARNQGWRGSITDLASGVETVVRNLEVDADSLRHPMVWTESFAHCDHPGTVVRWSEMQALTASGQIVKPVAVKLSYQTHQAGGCANSNTAVAVDNEAAAAIIQATNAERTNQAGSHLVFLPPVG